MGRPKSSKQLPSKASTTDLLKALDDDSFEFSPGASAPNLPASDDEDALTLLSDPENNEKEADFFGFLNAMKMDTGEHPVAKKLIYQIYSRWSDLPISMGRFYYILNNYFVSHTNPKFILLNTSAMSLNVFSKKVISLRAKQRDRRKSPKYTAHVQAFLNHYNIKPGKVKMPYAVLYHLYDKWSYSLGKRPLFSYATLLSMLAVKLKVAIRWIGKDVKGKRVYRTNLLVDASLIKNVTNETVQSLILTQGSASSYDRKTKTKIHEFSKTYKNEISQRKAGSEPEDES
jgi:hypothetical protein